MNLNELIPAYREYLRHERKLADNTLYSYTTDVRKLAAFVNKPVASITRDDLRAFMRHMSKEGYEANTIRRVFHGFGTLFKWLYLEGHTEKVLTEYIDLPRKNDTAPTWMDETHWRMFLAACDGAHGLAWRTLALTGMRPDELRKLTVQNVKLNGDDSALIVRNTKSKRDRVIPLDKSLVEPLAGLIAGLSPEAYVFGTGGAIWNRLKMIKAFQYQLERAGLQGHGYTMYSLRHTYATYLANEGTNLHVVKEVMGHKSLETTQKYLHTSHESVKAAMSKITGG